MPTAAAKWRHLRCGAYRVAMGEMLTV